MQTLNYLNNLIGQPLRYGIKSPDTELYDFGFGDIIESYDIFGRKRSVCNYALHTICDFDVISKHGQRKVDSFDGNSDDQVFSVEIKTLIGLKVEKISLDEKNNLTLDFGNYEIVFYTLDDDEESWRILEPGVDKLHLVAANSWIRFE